MSRLPYATICLAALAATAPGCNDSPAAQSSASDESATAPSADGRVLETTFDDVKFEMDSNDQFRDDLITPEIKKRFDRRIRIRGYMFPTLRQSGLKQFVLVRDNMECCFGPGAMLYDCVLVYMRDGAATDYKVLPVTVEGEFRFEKLSAGPDGPLMAIYRLDDAVVR